MKPIIYAIISLLFSANIIAQNVVTVELQKNSHLFIHGSTNIVSFRIEQDGEKFMLKSNQITTKQLQNRLYFVDNNEITIAVKNFTSINKMALRDFKKLLKSDKFPTLQVKINYLEMVSNNDNLQTVKGNASIIIVLTAISKQYFIPITAVRDRNLLIVKGTKKLSIRDFGLEPPTEMLGMIKVDEWINIEFDLICKVTPI